MASQAKQRLPSPLELRGGIRDTGSINTNNSAANYFNAFQDSIGEPHLNDLNKEYFEDVQSIQLKFFDWAQFMMLNPPMYQGRPVDPKTTIYNYYGLIKTRLKEKYPRHPDWENHEEEWFNPYRGELVKTIQSKINKGEAQDNGEEFVDITNHHALVYNMTVKLETKMCLILLQ